MISIALLLRRNIHRLVLKDKQQEVYCLKNILMQNGELDDLDGSSEHPPCIRKDMWCVHKLNQAKIGLLITVGEYGSVS